MKQQLKIGNVTIATPVLLAPMAGYTDTAFRSICMRYHAGATFTEVVNATGIMINSKQTLHLLETVPEERPIAAHIYGNDPAIMAKAAIVIEKLNRFDYIDINCGCPVRKIVLRGCGAALIKSPKLIESIVKAVRESVSMPVTIKTRIGFEIDQNNVVDLVQAAESGGASAVTIHARYAKRIHNGPADWASLKLAKESCSIPVIGNGGVECANDVVRMFNETGVDGVMIGRAAVGNPWIFDEAYCLMQGKPYTQHTPQEHKQIIVEHLSRMLELKIKEYKVRRRKKNPVECSTALNFRAHLFRYIKGMRGCGEIRRKLQYMNSLEKLLESVNTILPD